MKKAVSAVLAMLMVLSSVAHLIGFASEKEEDIRYNVTLYEDSTKSKILYKKQNQKAGNRFVITFDIYKEGYSFVSWIDADTGEEISFYNNIVTVPEKNAEYYIRWQVNSYKLLYVNGESEFASFDVDYSTPAYEMPVPSKIPEREGYEFKGWSSIPATMPAADMVAVAQWEDICTQANFYVNKSDETPFASVPLEEGEKITAPNATPVNRGYYFRGWSLDGETVAKDLGTMNDRDVSVYALWSPVKYLATFNANGGAFSDGEMIKSFSVEYGSKIEFDEVPTAKGLIFNGWTPKVDTMHNVNGINFRANWINKGQTYYTVRTYVMDTNGKYSSTDKMYNADAFEIVNAAYTVDEGFELNKSKSCLTAAVLPDSSLVLKVYLDRKLCDFYVNVDGKKERKTYLYGEKTDKAENPQKDGYVFLGWYPEYPDTMPSADYTVTAIWKEAEKVHVHTEKTIFIEPTCETEGKQHIICEVCGESIGEATLFPAKGHSAGDWLVVLEPTHESEGSKVKKCLECGKILEEALIEKTEKPIEPDDSCKAVLEIKNINDNINLDYSETLNVEVVVSDMPEGSRVEWSVSGEGVKISKHDSDFCMIESVSDGVSKLTATLVDANGEAIRNSEGEKISDSVSVISNAGLWQRIVAFFKKLFYGIFSQNTPGKSGVFLLTPELLVI